MKKIINTIVLTVSCASWAAPKSQLGFIEIGNCVEINHLSTTESLEEITIFQNLQAEEEGLLRRAGVDHLANILCLSACGINLIYANNWPFLFLPIGKTTTEWQEKSWACTRYES